PTQPQGPRGKSAGLSASGTVFLADLGFTNPSVIFQVLLGTPALLAVGHGTFCELLDGRLAERVEVGGLAARDEALLDNDLLVDPRAPGVADVGAQARPRRHRPAPDPVPLDQPPWST